MIGKVTGVQRPGGKVVEATLDDDGTWQCGDESIVERLVLFFDPRRDAYMSPARGQWGYAAVADAAAYLGGKAELPEVADAAGVVY